jgi:glycosyltransferase involved in cell wall biosynthesis
MIFFSSRIAPEKDADTLLEAVRRLLDMGRDLWLLHRSGGYATLIASARKFGISARLIATDAVHPQKGLADDYRASDACVQASREEGLGFSVLEAMACGVPAIAADIGGLKETVLDGHTGWLYRVGDPGALADCITSVINDPVEAARRGAEGREMVCRRFNREAVFSKLENVVRDSYL